LKARSLSVLLLALFVTTFVVAAEVQSVHAAVQDFHLYGYSTVGWGFSSSSMTSPGPTITVNEGDVVNLTLTNADDIYASPHQFLLSYHNGSTLQLGDVESPQFAGGETIVFSFTANVSGTFTYYCVFHPSMMYGTFIVTSAIPEFPSLMVLSDFMVVAVFAVALYSGKMKRSLVPR
jgi:FtsP/CotA-like multicopper oxidase with cupredoxin domain